MKENFKLNVMKNTLKIALSAVLLVAAFGLALTFCTPKSEKPVAEDTPKVDSTVVVQPDTTVQEPVKDSAESK